MPRSVQVRLRTGVTHAILPDGRSMKSGTNYTISWEDFQKISGAARLKAVEVVAGSVSDAAGARNPNVNLAYDAATVPTGFKIGAVEEGVQENDRFILIKNVGAAAALGEVLVWTDIAKREATRAHTATTATARNFAGVAQGAIGANNYAWVQNDGHVATVSTGGTANGSPAAGDPVAIHPTVDGGTRTAITGDTVIGTATTAAAGGAAGPPAVNSTFAMTLTPATGRAPRFVRTRSRVL